MSRKLWLLNLTLLAVTVYAGFEFQREWQAKKARQSAALKNGINPVTGQPFIRQPTPQPVLPSTYAPVAQHFLFDPSRNPDVIIVPPPPPPAPAPKVVPALPVFHGEMNLDGPIAILSVTANSRAEAIHPGEMIGPFKLVAINRTALTLEWDGELITKNIDELAIHTSAPEQSSNNAGEAVHPPMAVAPPPVEQGVKGPGEKTQFGVAPCQPGDTSPVGTVKDNMRKVMQPTPFGSACLWEPVSK